MLRNLPLLLHRKHLFCPRGGSRIQIQRGHRLRAVWGKENVACQALLLALGDNVRVQGTMGSVTSPERGVPVAQSLVMPHLHSYSQRRNHAEQERKPADA